MRATHTRAGFTLVEVLVIAPIVILVLGALVGAIIALTGSVLITQKRTQVAYELQAALNVIEHDTKGSALFVPDTGALTSPQGSDGSTASFTSGSTVLILQAPLTSANPLNDGRELVHYADRSEACESPNVTGNDIAFATIVYFVRDDALWRRTIVPDLTGGNAACDTPWQQNSCAPGAIGSLCQTEDDLLVAGIGNEQFNVIYYATVDSTVEVTGGDIASAQAIAVSITSQQLVAGNELSLTSGQQFALPQ